MKSIIACVTIATAAYAALACNYAQAQAQSIDIPRCAPRADMMDILKQKFQEVPAYSATSRQAMIEMTLSPKGSWTLLVISPEGIACVITDGNDWIEGLPGKDA
ncbi:MAG: hypothetical protein H0X01_02690 [Nitrospira sp.]|nr:hypothetical protein [Nitrospira sp.]